MTTTPTLETLAEKAYARGVKLGEKDAPGGVDRGNENPLKNISDIVLLYEVFVDMPHYEIEIDYLVSEFLLGYAYSFYRTGVK